jgi:hypothetical protein
LNDGLTHALEAWDIENFEGMVNKALVLENHRVAMEHKRKFMRQHQLGSSSRPRAGPPTATPIYAVILFCGLCLHLPVEPTLFLLLLSRTKHVGESTMLLRRKPKKLQSLSLVCFPLTTLL